MHAITPFAFSPPPVAMLGDEARIVLKAARMWVMLARNHRSPRAVLNGLLGEATPRFSLLMDCLVSAWADSFTTYPPCATALSPDEHLLLNMLACAEADDRADFDALLSDLLPMAERDRLWAASLRLMAERVGIR